MSGRHGSTVFVHVGDADRVEAAIQSVLKDEGYTYGAMKRIPIARLAIAANEAWTVAVPDPPFDFSDRTKRGVPLLAEIARRLQADAFQLDASDYSAGLLEVRSTGKYLISGLLRRWDSGGEPDADDDGDLVELSEEPVATLRKILRSRNTDSDERDHAVLRISRAMIGPDFDPHEPEEFEFDAEQEVLYRVALPSALSTADKPETVQPPPNQRSKKRRPAHRVK